MRGPELKAPAWAAPGVGRAGEGQAAWLSPALARGAPARRGCRAQGPQGSFAGRGPRGKAGAALRSHRGGSVRGMDGQTKFAVSRLPRGLHGDGGFSRGTPTTAPPSRRDRKGNSARHEGGGGASVSGPRMLNALSETRPRFLLSVGWATGRVWGSSVSAVTHTGAFPSSGFSSRDQGSWSLGQGSAGSNCGLGVL